MSNAPAAETVTGLPAEISVQDAYQYYQDDTLILDVRTQEEWDAGHVPNATLIPLDQLPTRLGELPQDQDIVVICRSGNRSAQGRDILLSAGFENVTSVAGGFNEWVANDYPFVTGP
ncbi:rhodanese-like domain-containing protein [bacterium]|nr:rhodanese-like domain-containing protein [bacterium]MCB2178980.1 rhodanese-like domain-containing protein [bacterium]